MRSGPNTLGEEPTSNLTGYEDIGLLISEFRLECVRLAIAAKNTGQHGDVTKIAEDIRNWINGEVNA